MDPTIDIIIPVYNPGPFLELCVESCLSQLYLGKYKITIIDDGSTEVLPKTWGKRVGIDIEMIRSEENKGAAYARNVGIKHTTGDLIVFQDADDMMTPDRLAITVEHFQNNPSTVMVCGNWRWEVDGVMEENPRFLEPHPIIDQVALLFDFPVVCSTVSLRRKVLEKTGLFNESYEIGEDYDLWARVLEHYPNQVQYIHKELLYHHRHATPYSLTKRYMWTDRYYQILDEIRKKYGLV